MKQPRREDTLAAENRHDLAVETEGLSGRLARGVRARRIELKLTQDKASERARINPRLWGRIESGESNATLGTLRALGRALEVDPVKLFAPLPEEGTADERR